LAIACRHGKLSESPDATAIGSNELTNIISSYSHRVLTQVIARSPKLCWSPQLVCLKHSASRFQQSPVRQENTNNSVYSVVATTQEY